MFFRGWIHEWQCNATPNRTSRFENRMNLARLITGGGGGGDIHEALRSQIMGSRVVHHARQECFRLPSGHRRWRRRQDQERAPQRRRAKRALPYGATKRRGGRTRRPRPIASARRQHRRHCLHAARCAFAYGGGGRVQGECVRYEQLFPGYQCDSMVQQQAIYSSSALEGAQGLRWTTRLGENSCRRSLAPVVRDAGSGRCHPSTGRNSSSSGFATRKGEKWRREYVHYGVTKYISLENFTLSEQDESVAPAAQFRQVLLLSCFDRRRILIGASRKVAVLSGRWGRKRVRVF